MSTASATQALTEEQRQQIIAKLLSERRSQAANAASRQQAELPQEERTARLQELISRRAAAKQQQSLSAQEPVVQQQQPSARHKPQHAQQQQQQQQQLHSHKHDHQQWQGTHRGPEQHQAQQRHGQHHRQQPHRPPSSIASSSCGRDSLLSPGSTASMAGTVATAAGTNHQRHQRQHIHQHQPQHSKVLQQPQRSSTSPEQLPRRPGLSAAVQHSAGPRQQPAPRQQQYQVPTPRQQQQQSRPEPPRQPQQAARSAVERSVLSRVLDGPVDISDLWASRASLNEQGSSQDITSHDSHSSGYSHEGSSCSQGSQGSEEERYTLGSALTGSSISDSGSEGGFGAGRRPPVGVAYEYKPRRETGSSWDDESELGVELEASAEWQLSGSLTFAPAEQSSHWQQQQLLQRSPKPQLVHEQRFQQLQQLQQELQQQRQQRGLTNAPSGAKAPLQQQHRRQQQQQQQRPQASLHRPAPPQQPRLASFGGSSSSPQHLPASYPVSRTERLQQLAQPKALQRQKYDQMKAEAEQQVLQHCSFAPKTGRGPQHRVAPPGSIGERLHKAAAEKKARMEQKAAALAHSDVEDCTFQPQTNAAANARVLESYEYVPLHKRLGQVMRSRSEKLAHIQQQVEAEVHGCATFAPRINPRSSMLASMRRSRSCSRVRGGGGDRSLSPGREDVGGGAGPQSPYKREHQDASEGQDVSRGRSRERAASTGRLRRTWSEAALSRGRSQTRAEDSACTFAPSINSRSEKMLQASGEIPLSFLQRQEYFDRLAREKKQLLQLAVEDAHCSFVPATRSSSRSARSDRGGSLDQESFLDRIERLAYTDKRRLEASRSAIADHVHNNECTFRPAINRRSARMVRATPLQELYENSKGRIRRDSVALAVELQEQAECTFTPSLHKPRPMSGSPAEAKLSLSAEEVACVVDRLYSDPRAKEARVGEAASYQQYQELKACTFKPETNKEVPKPQGPVLVRGLGRFLELKDMAKQQAEAKAAVEAKVFITQPKSPAAPFTTPQPFRLGPQMPSGYEARRRRAVAEAEAAAMSECTFQPRINTHHKTRQERVAELLAQQ